MAGFIGSYFESLIQHFLFQFVDEIFFVICHSSFLSLLLSNSGILKFWNLTFLSLLFLLTQTKHETICQTVWNNIKALSSVLSSELIDYLLEKIQQIPVNEYTPNTLLFIREITLASIQYSVRSVSLSFLRPWLAQPKTNTRYIEQKMQDLNFSFFG